MRKIIVFGGIALVSMFFIFYISLRILFPKYVSEQIKIKNYCHVSTECKVLSGLGCPFGCYYIINSNENIESLKNTSKYYNLLGSSCLYKCPSHPKFDEIQCVNSRCVDSRFEK